MERKESSPAVFFGWPGHGENVAELTKKSGYHPSILIVTRGHVEGSLPPVALLNTNQVVGITEVRLIEDLGPLAGV